MSCRHHTDTAFDLTKLAAPVDVAGHWVLRKDFNGHKSFGCFYCGACHNRYDRIVFWVRLGMAQGSHQVDVQKQHSAHV